MQNHIKKLVTNKSYGFFFIRNILWSVSRGIIIFGIGFTLVYPLLFMFTTAFRSRSDLWNPSIIWITREYTLDHIKTLFEVMDYSNVLKNSIFISIGSAILQTFICGMVGYAFARYDFKGKKILFTMVILTIIVPPQTLIISQFVLFKYFQIPVLYDLFKVINIDTSINLLNTYFVFWIPSALGVGIRSGLFIFIFRQFFRGMPKDLENASYIDGGGIIKTYFSVMLPNAIPAMITVFLFSIVWHWNEYFISSLFLSTNRTISVALAELRTVVYRMSDAGEQDPLIVQVRVQAGALLSILPMIGLFAFGQRYFTESIERTGIVG